MNILLLLNTLVLFLETVKAHENVKRNKSKGHRRGNTHSLLNINTYTKVINYD
jgi:hypothetical protein